MGSAVDLAIEEAISQGEVAVQVAVYRHGRLVIDTAMGPSQLGGSPIDSATVFFAASAGKVSTATLLHGLVARGQLDYEQTIASVWPEFAANGKESFTVRDALTHRIGLADVPQGAVLGEWDDVVGRLAQHAPSRDPSARDSYHAFTWGFVVGEIARRADPERRPFAQLVKDEVHAPLGITELWHALPPGEHERTAVVAGDIFRGDPFDFAVTEDHFFNTASHREHLDPSGAWMTAHAGARLWALYAGYGELDGVRLLSPAQVDSFLRSRASDRPLGILVGQRGVMGRGALMLGGAVPDHARVLGFGARVLWHPGAGGTLGFADLDAGISAMICHNRLFDERSLPSHPFAPVIRAIYSDVLD